MGQERRSVTNRSSFYKNVEEVNPTLVLGLIIISVGLYIINWIYLRNRDFELLDKEAPDSKRGAVVMMVLPFLWFFISFTLQKLFFKESIIFSVISTILWIIILIIIIKYLFDFCSSYARISKRNGVIWFSLFLVMLIGALGIIIDFYYITPLIFFGFVGVPAMQADINTFYKRFLIKKERDVFYN